MPRAHVAVGPEADVDDPIEQQQSGALQVPERIEMENSAGAAIAIARDRCGQIGWAAEFFGTCGDVQGVESLEVGAVFLGLPDNINRAR